MGNRFGPAAIQKPEYAGNTLDSGMGYGGVADLYCYHRLDMDGNETASQTFAYELYADMDMNKYEINETEYPKAEWEEQFSVYEKMLKDEALHLKWEYVFPAEEPTALPFSALQTDKIFSTGSTVSDWMEHWFQPAVLPCLRLVLSAHSIRSGPERKRGVDFPAFQ